MNGKKVVLSGAVAEVSRPGIHTLSRSSGGLTVDQDEQVTFLIEGAVPLWAELRIPNNHRWIVGDRVAISIVSLDHK